MNLPNKLTLARIIAVPFFIVFYMKDMYWVSLIIFVLASLTDMADGKIARKYNLVTNFGKIMDPLADKILVYAAFTLMVANNVIPGWTLIIILFREFLVAGVRTVAASKGTVIAADMAGKIKTFLQMFAVPCLIIKTISPVFFYAGYVLFYASLVMTVISGANYCIKNKSVFQG